MQHNDARIKRPNKWVKDFGTRHDMKIKVVAFDHNIIKYKIYKELKKLP